MTRYVATTATVLVLRSLPRIGPDTDTGKRLSAGQTAIALGQTFDGLWLFLDAPNGDGWASAAYLADAPAPAPVVAAPSGRYTLEGEDPELTAAMERLREAGALDGIEFQTADFGGVRSEADTVRIMRYRDDDYAVYVRNLKASKPGASPISKEIWRPIAPFGSSMHNYGCARDVKITKRPPSFTEADAQRRLGALAPSCGLRWGGTFSQKVDPPHFELPITLAQARHRAGQ